MIINPYTFAGGGGGGSAPVLDATSDAENIGNTTMTFSHTCTGSDRLLLVGVTSSIGGITGITYNGVSMSLQGSVSNNDSGANTQCSVYSLIAPATGANDIVITLTGPPAYQEAIGASFTGVHQTTPLGTLATNTGNNHTTPTVDVSGASGDLIVDFTGCTSTPTTATEGSGQTSIEQRLVTDGHSIFASTEAGDTTVTMNWTLGVAKWTVSCGQAIKPV